MQTGIERTTGEEVGHSVSEWHNLTIELVSLYDAGWLVSISEIISYLLPFSSPNRTCIALIYEKPDKINVYLNRE